MMGPGNYHELDAGSAEIYMVMVAKLSFVGTYAVKTIHTSDRLVFVVWKPVQVNLIEFCFINKTLFEDNKTAAPSMCLFSFENIVLFLRGNTRKF